MALPSNVAGGRFGLDAALAALTLGAALELGVALAPAGTLLCSRRHESTLRLAPRRAHRQHLP